MELPMKVSPSYKFLTLFELFCIKKFFLQLSTSYHHVGRLIQNAIDMKSEASFQLDIPDFLQTCMII